MADAAAEVRPGSFEARHRGCVCPVVINVGVARDEVLIAPDCRVHSSEADAFLTLMALDVEDSDETAPLRWT